MNNCFLQKTGFQVKVLQLHGKVGGRDEENMLFVSCQPLPVTSLKQSSSFIQPSSPCPRSLYLYLDFCHDQGKVNELKSNTFHPQAFLIQFCKDTGGY